MLNLIVLGIIPGTQIQLTFLEAAGLLVSLPLMALIVYDLKRLLRRSNDTLVSVVPEQQAFQFSDQSA